MTLLPGKTRRSRPVGERMGSAAHELPDQGGATSGVSVDGARSVAEYSHWCCER